MEDEQFLSPILDPEQMSFSREPAFSHPTIVMNAYIKCVNAGCVEMVKGYWDVKLDKFGNAVRSYNSDTRQIFINSVETLKNTLISNFDEEANKKVGEYYLKMREAKKHFLKQESDWYNSLPFNLRTKTQHLENTLNQDGIFYHQFINYQVEIYRLIFQELELLLKRSKYLKKQVYGNLAKPTKDVEKEKAEKEKREAKTHIEDGEEVYDYVPEYFEVPDDYDDSQISDVVLNKIDPSHF